MRKKLLTAGAIALSVAILSFAAVGPASAQSYLSCPAAYTCFNAKNGDFGKVMGTNNAWGNFGWNDRAVRFYNNGNTHNIKLFEHQGHWGDRRVVYRGHRLTWKNYYGGGLVSSNEWFQ